MWREHAVEVDAARSRIGAAEALLPELGYAGVGDGGLRVHVVHGVDDVAERGAGGGEHLLHAVVAPLGLRDGVVRLQRDDAGDPDLVVDLDGRRVGQLLESLELRAGRDDGFLLSLDRDSVDFDQRIRPQQTVHQHPRRGHRALAHVLLADRRGAAKLAEAGRRDVVGRAHDVVVRHARRFEDDPDLLPRHLGLLHDVALAKDAPLLLVVRARGVAGDVDDPVLLRSQRERVAAKVEPGEFVGVDWDDVSGHGGRLLRKGSGRGVVYRTAQRVRSRRVYSSGGRRVCQPAACS